MTETEAPVQARHTAWPLWIAAYFLAILSAGELIDAIGDWLTGRPHDIPLLWAIVMAQQVLWFVDQARARRRRERS